MSRNQNPSNKNGKRSQGKPQSKPRPRKTKEVEENIPEASLNAADLHSSNDASWYLRSGALSESAARLSYSEISGIPFTPSSTSPQIVEWRKQTIPGICAMAFIPTIGHAENANSAVNAISKSLYAFIRSRISGSRPYDPQDVMIADIAMDSAFMWWTHLTRVYGVLDSVDNYNRFKPATLVEAMGFNFQELLLNISDFRDLINYFARQLSAICVPRDMAYNTRHAWMCANIFTDSSTAKAQIYLFKPAGYYTYNELTTHGGELTFNYLPANNLGMEDIRSICNAIIDPLLGSNSIGQISGDMLTAFGISGVFMMSQITEDFRVTPIYSQEVLSQIENACIVPGAQPSKIIQHTNINEGYLTQSVTVPFQSSMVDALTGQLHPDARFVLADQILNMHIMQPDPGLNYVATRLMVSATASVTNDVHVNDRLVLDGIGSEILVGAAIYYMPVKGTVVYATHFGSCLVHSGDDNVAVQTFLSMWNAFDWAPKVFFTTRGQADPATEVLDILELDAPFVDYDNYAVLSPALIKKLHEVALISLFDIPTLPINR